MAPKRELELEVSSLFTAMMIEARNPITVSARKIARMMAMKLTLAEVRAARDAAMRVHLSPAIKDFIVRLVTAPREAAKDSEIGRMVEHPASPRGTLALAAAAKARAYLYGRDFAVPEDVADLAPDILAHRTLLTWRATADGATPRKVVEMLLDRVRPL